MDLKLVWEGDQARVSVSPRHGVKPYPVQGGLS